MTTKDTEAVEDTQYYEEEFEIPVTKLTKVEQDDKVFFEGVAVTTDHVNELELIDIDKYFVNTPVTYRHDHPSMKRGGGIYGRVVEREIQLEPQEDGSKKGILKFKTEMRTYHQRQRDLIDNAKTQQDIGKPIGWSIGFTSTKDKSTNLPIHAEVFEVAVTNNPHDKSALNEVITMEDTDKEKIVAELQKQFEDKYGIQIKKLEDTLTEKDESIENLETQIKTFEDKAKASDSLIEQIKKYEAELKINSEKVKLLEEEAERNKRLPLVEKIFQYEGSEQMKARYLDPTKWTEEELLKQFEEVKARSPKGMADKVLIRTLEESRQSAMGEQKTEELKEFESSVKEQMSPELKRLIYGV